MAGVKGRSGGARPNSGPKPMTAKELRLTGQLHKLRLARKAAERRLKARYLERVQVVRRQVADKAVAVVEELEATARAVLADAAIAAEPVKGDPLAPQASGPVDIEGRIAQVRAELEPLATAVGTLTPGSRMAFEELCEIVVMKRAMRDAILTEGFLNGRGQAHPLISRYSVLSTQVQAGLDRFGLSADGAGAPPEEEDDPMDEFDKPRRAS